MNFSLQSSGTVDRINMSSIVFGVLLLAFFVTSVYTRNLKRSVLREYVDFPLVTTEIINFHGYNAETHTVETADGYYIQMHRITGVKNEFSNNNKTKPVVLIMHGILCSSSSWVLTGPDKSLAYILSDAGYDVWMGNFRGTKYSNTHRTLKNHSSKFWDFSWHEMGKYDLPAMIGYLIRRTGVEKIFYIGHSQGTTAYFVMSSLYSEYTEKHLHTAITLAPVAYLANIKNTALKFLTKLVQTFTINTVQTMMSLHDFTQTSSIIRKVMDYFCDKSKLVEPMCDNFLFTLGGYDENQTNKTLLPIIWNHVPAGASMKQFTHYAQLVQSERFQMYDNGAIYNLIKYYSIYPKSYDLKKCKLQVALYYSDNDWISTPKDVKQLYWELSNVTTYRVPYENFTHLDFIWAIDVKNLLYDHVLKYMSKFL